MNATNTRIEVHATPNARRVHVGGTHQGALKVRVTETAEKGRANNAIKQALAKALGIRKAQITLISGDTHRRKIFEITVPPEKLAPVVERLRQQA